MCLQLGTMSDTAMTNRNQGTLANHSNAFSGTAMAGNAVDLTYTILRNLIHYFCRWLQSDRQRQHAHATRSFGGKAGIQARPRLELDGATPLSVSALLSPLPPFSRFSMNRFFLGILGPSVPLVVATPTTLAHPDAVRSWRGPVRFMRPQPSRYGSGRARSYHLRRFSGPKGANPPIANIPAPGPLCPKRPHMKPGFRGR